MTSRPHVPGALLLVRRNHPALASSLDLGALLRARIRSAPRRLPSAKRPLLSSGCAPPELCSELVLGPFVPRAVTPRVRSSFTNSAGGYPAQSGVSPSPMPAREGGMNGRPASAIVGVRRQRPCRLSAAVPDPHGLQPGRGASFA